MTKSKDTKQTKTTKEVVNLPVEEILRLYKPLVCKIARGYFLEGGEIDDLVQEGMIGLYKATKSFDKTKDASFKTFATLCITRQIQSAVRSANSKKNTFFLQLLDDSQPKLYDKPTNKENPESKIIAEQSYQQMQTDIQNLLSKKEYTILKVFLQGYSYEQIANLLGTTKKSVDNALARVRSKLSHLLSDKWCKKVI